MTSGASLSIVSLLLLRINLCLRSSGRGQADLCVDATFATVLQLTLLLLLVRQMEQTRTPSLLSKVSLWTIVMMGVTDSWIFSAHVVMGILSESKSSITLLVPGFLGLCSAVVFGPVSLSRALACQGQGD